MGISDLIKKSIIEGFVTDITTTEICVTLGLAIVFGIYIYAVYRFKSKSQFYSIEFNTSLAVLPLITAAIVLAIQSNLVISLGMVGALSIVRFRNAVKSTMDLMFLFFAISIGIIVGAELFELAIIFTILTSMLLLLLDYIPVKKAPYLLVLSMSTEQDKELLYGCLKNYTNAYNVKSQSIRNSSVDMIIEIRCKDIDLLLDALQKFELISSVNLLQHDGSIRV